MTFNEYAKIDLDLYSFITDFLAERDDGCYGKILFPTQDHFQNKANFKLDNRMLVALYAEDAKLASDYSMDFVRHFFDTEYNYVMEFCWKPLVYISFNGPRSDKRVLNESNEVILEQEYSRDSISFRLDCNFQEFDVYVNDILDKFESEGCEFNVEYYF